MKALTAQEELFVYTNCSELDAKAGCVGHLRGYFEDAEQMVTDFTDHLAYLKTQQFKDALATVISGLAAPGGPLWSMAALANWCAKHQEHKLRDDSAYGFRADTEEFAFLLRLTPDKGEHNLYCYCYMKSWLDSYLAAAEKGIRFIDTQYNELFTLDNGDRIRIDNGSDAPVEKQVFYVDDCHIAVGAPSSVIYHICEFAELMETAGKKVSPLRRSLPDACYAYIKSTGEIGVIKKGETGYYRTEIQPMPMPAETAALVEETNSCGGVTKAQSAAMKAGSLFGWGCKMADPAFYGEDGAFAGKRRKVV